MITKTHLEEYILVISVFKPNDIEIQAESLIMAIMIFVIEKWMAFLF